MAIKKIKISNFKCFKGDFEFKLKNGINILVGDNNSGKSTILEAINLSLTGQYHGRNINNEISQYIFNKEIVDSYIDSVKKGEIVEPPCISIEVFFFENTDAEYEGNMNSENNKNEGFIFKMSFDEKYRKEYNELVRQKNIMSLPIEYYEMSWETFARQAITSRNIPIKSSIIDSSNYRYQNGSDIYISRIVKNILSDEEIIAVSQAHRKMKDRFVEDESIRQINKKIEDESSIVDGVVSLTVDLGTKNAWERSLVTQLNEIPFENIGKGSQCIMKTELALTQKRAHNAQIVLLEEPENHLSFSKMNQFIKAIEEKCEDKQIIISTHSSFVANKLGLDNLLLLKNNRIVPMQSLPSVDFFKKMSGYDTLRMILCEKAILVEGDSDELVVQKAYQSENNDRLPIENKVDVISVGTAFLRFLEIAKILKLNVVVVTDNDGEPEALANKYREFTENSGEHNIKICYDREVDTGDIKVNGKPFNYNTLEPKLFKANNNDVDLFRRILNVELTDVDSILKYMKNNKTETALSVFNCVENIKFPEYILKAIENE